jgi:signal transduction histidine kinase
MFEAFMPHGYCMMWEPGLVWLHAASDAGIVVAYYAIPIALFTLLKRKKQLPFPQLFALFGAFILACGTTHLFSLITIWEPWYWLEGALKALTAGISLVTVAVLVPLFPRALTLPTPSELEEANASLRLEIKRREALEQTLIAKEDQLTHLADRLLNAQEDERRRIARDLHDDSGQTLSILQMELEMLLQTVEVNEAARTRIAGWGDRLEELQQGLRGVSHRLHPSILDIVGLEGGLRGICESVPGCNIKFGPEVDTLSSSMSLDVYRLVQECLNNVTKHASADNVEVCVEVLPDMVRIVVEDDGVGFNPDDSNSGLGLVGMRERVLSRRGSISVKSQPGQGARVEVELSRVKPKKEGARRKR